MDFGGTTVAVFGGAGLLGSAIVEGLASCNAIPLIIDLDTKASKSIRNKIVEQGGQAYCHQADCSKVENISSIVEEVENSFGHISRWALSFYPHTEDWNNPLEHISSESWSKNVDMQMNTICLCASEIAKRIANHDGGSIVTIGSIYGSIAPTFNIYKGTEMTVPPAYAAIKGGISNFSKYLASYYGSRNVRVNCVVPGGIINNQPQSFIKNFSALTSLDRLAQPEEVASAIIYLLSDSASYITGIDLPVDGGYLSK